MVSCQLPVLWPRLSPTRIALSDVLCNRLAFFLPTKHPLPSCSSFQDGFCFAWFVLWPCWRSFTSPLLHFGHKCTFRTTPSTEGIFIIHCFLSSCCGITHLFGSIIGTFLPSISLQWFPFFEFHFPFIINSRFLLFLHFFAVWSICHFLPYEVFKLALCSSRMSIKYFWVKRSLKSFSISFLMLFSQE